MLGGGTYYLYPNPNPRLSEILVGNGVRDVVAEYLMRVEATYATAIMSRPSHRTHEPGDPSLENSIVPEIYIGGFENDRWVGELHVTARYAMADEVGREDPAPGQNDSTTEGHHSLRDALYAHLPQI